MPVVLVSLKILLLLFSEYQDRGEKSFVIQTLYFISNILLIHSRKFNKSKSLLIKKETNLRFTQIYRKAGNFFFAVSQKKAENSTFFLLIHIEGGEIKRNLHRLGETSHSLPWGNHPTPPIFSFSDKKGFNLWAPKNKIPFSFLKYFYLSSHFLVRFLRILSENIEKCFLSREHLLIEQIHRKISSLGDWKCENPTNPIASLFLSNRLRLLLRNILIKYLFIKYLL